MPSKPTNEKSIWVYIKLGGEGFAHPVEFDLRYILEDEVETREIGKLEGAGSGGGWMDFSFGVDNIAAACRALGELKKLITEYNVPNDAVRFDIVHKDEEICDSLPEFQLGDCLCYRFEDGDYGAAIVLSDGLDDSSASMNQSQSGMPPVDSQSRETLLGILDYKNSVSPSKSDFEKKNWLIGTHDSWKGKPYRIWLHCFGDIDVKIVHQIPMQAEVIDCRFHLSWNLLAEYFIREKYRDNKELNPYESRRDAKSLNRPKFLAGDCLSYRFSDGDYGAAIVLKNSDGDFNTDEMLLGILDYKHQSRPTLAIFEARNWLLSKHEWQSGLPLTLWAHYCWSSDCKGIDAQQIEHTTLKHDEIVFTQLGLFWEGIPELVLFEMKSN